MPPVGFEPTISAGERPQTYSLDRAATATGIYMCPKRNVPDFVRVFLMLNYTDITQNTYVQSWTVTEIMASGSLKLWQLLHTYWLPNTYWNWQEYVVSVMLISVLNIKLNCEWHKTIKLNYKALALLSYLSLGFQVLYAGRSRSVILWRQSYRALTAV